jgi:hypothetical protein
MEASVAGEQSWGQTLKSSPAAQDLRQGVVAAEPLLPSRRKCIAAYCSTVPSHRRGVSDTVPLHQTEDNATYATLCLLYSNPKLRSHSL